MKKHYKQLLLIWAVYIFVVNLVPFVIAYFDFISTPVRTFKELAFGIWGYAWDGGLNLDVALNGYSYPLQAKFPLYPLLIRLLNVFLPLSLTFRINIILLLLALPLLYKLSGYFQKDHRYKMVGIIMFLLYPSAFFLQANYTETAFILLASLGLLALLNKKYLQAALICGLLTGIKAGGISLALTLLVVYARDHYSKESLSKLLSKLFLLGVISVSGTLLYFLFLEASFGSYTLFFEAQSEWGRVLGSGSGFFEVINKIRFPDSSTFRHVLELFTAFFALYLLKIAYKKLPLELYMYSALQIILPVSTGSLMSLNRLLLFSFPLLLFFGTRKRSNRFLAIYAGVCGGLQILMITLFFNNIFVG